MFKVIKKSTWDFLQRCLARRAGDLSEAQSLTNKLQAEKRKLEAEVAQLQAQVELMKEKYDQLGEVTVKYGQGLIDIGLPLAKEEEESA